MKTTRYSSNSRLGFSVIAPLLLIPGLGGCMFIKAPPTDAIPPPVKEPTGWVFDPADGDTAGTALNKEKDAVYPDFFTVPDDQVQSADLVSILSWDNGKAGSTAEPVHLAGIIAPKEGQPGWLEAKAALQGWLRDSAGPKRVDVIQDTVYPTDLDGRRMVGIKFFGNKGGPHEKDKMVLNRMLVRAGYAVVDLYSPTSFDSKVWLSDEAYARRLNLGLWKQPDTFTILQQRVPANAALQSKNKLKVVVGSGGGPGVPGAPPAAHATPGAPATAPKLPAPAIPAQKPTPGKSA